MAGWLKFEDNTPEKPEVFAITVELGWDDPDLAVGKLLKVWRWFDQHTIDGNAVNVTLSLLDRISGVTGFAQAMCNVGWLIKDESGLSLPHFDRHNGKTAKDRALTAKRVAKHKSNDEGNASSVSLPLPREEENREEKNIKPIKSKAESATATRLPADWAPSDEDILFCQTERPDLQPHDVAARFKDHWISAPAAKARKADWAATWRNWVRREDAKQRGSPQGYESAREKSRRETIEGLTGRKQNDNRTIDIN
ncbi:MAG: hypothetical protein ACXU8A_00165 [Burkholderiaceae bacterium]